MGCGCQKGAVAAAVTPGARTVVADKPGIRMEMLPEHSGLTHVFVPRIGLVKLAPTFVVDTELAVLYLESKGYARRVT